MGRIAIRQYSPLEKPVGGRRSDGHRSAVTDDFGEMLALDLVESLTTKTIFNYFRLDGVLNVHAEYGYLVNEETARIVADWWRAHDSSLTSV